MAFNYTFDPTPRESYEYADASVINLIGGDAVCVVPFAVPSSEPGLFMNVTMSCTSAELIQVLDGAAVNQMQGPPNWPGSGGKYDANMARLMAIYASWIRKGADVGEYYIVGPSDVFTLLMYDPWTQGQIKGVLAANGFAGTSGNNGTPMVTGSFIAPSADSIKTPGGAPVTTSDQVPPVDGFETVVVGEDEEKTNWPLIVGGGAAVLGAGYVVMQMIKRGRR